MKSVEQYLALPYTKTVRWVQDDEVYVASIMEIPACKAHGESEEEALKRLRESFEDWLAFALEQKESVPLPRTDEQALPSGKWVQRVPRTLHKQLILAAEQESVSLNSFVTAALAREVGRHENAGHVAEKIQAAVSATSRNLHTVFYSQAPFTPG